MLVGTESAHALAYRLVYPEASLRASFLTATGHAYAAWLPLALAAAGAVALVSAAAAAADVVRGRRVRELGPVAFAVLPPLAFALQELLELSLHTGSVAWPAFAAPTFLPGLALQLPFALVAFVAARILLRVAVRIARALTRVRLPRVATAARRVCAPSAVSLHAACGASPRAPPLAAGI